MQNIQNGFYNHLRQEYNQQLVTDIKIYKQSISNLKKKREIQRKFLLQCRSCNVLPNQILNQTHINIRFFQDWFVIKLKTLQNFLAKKF